VVALLTAVQVVRTAVVARYAATNPMIATWVWPSHPSSEMWLGLTEIGSAMNQRRPVSPVVVERIMDAAKKAPLAAQPFLVRGVQAQLAGDERLAERAFLAARLRDGRSVPARYFLAEHYLRVGNAAAGLREIAILARRVPTGVASLAPYVAAYAKDQRAQPRLKALFRTDPQLEDAALQVLAGDPRNVDLILSLADLGRFRDRAPPWSVPLLGGLVRDGQYAKAHDVWSRVAHVRPAPGTLIFDAAFADARTPPPFNWALTGSTVGLAERQPGGRLHVLFYGQEDGALASQLLLLAPGRYRLSMQLSGDAARARSLVWSVTCANSNATLARIPLDAVAAAKGWPITVPDNCPAQKLELLGVAADLPQQVDLTISRLRLGREASNG
jgi:hypothetical protein